MKKLALIATAIVAFTAQASFAQEPADASTCTGCNRLILEQLRQIAGNTAAIRADLAALRARRPVRSAFVAERLVLRTSGQAGADSFCREVGYDAARIIAPPGNPVPPPDPFGYATVVCFQQPNRD